MTPSFIGLMATMLPGVRPSISLASLPTASTSLVFLFNATMEGSFTTMPLPRAYTSVLAVPRSMARSLENMLNSDRRLCERDEPLLNPLFDMAVLLSPGNSSRSRNMGFPQFPWDSLSCGFFHSTCMYGRTGGHCGHERFRASSSLLNHYFLLACVHPALGILRRHRDQVFPVRQRRREIMEGAVIGDDRHFFAVHHDAGPRLGFARDLNHVPMLDKRIQVQRKVYFFLRPGNNGKAVLLAFHRLLAIRIIRLDRPIIGADRQAGHHHTWRLHLAVQQQRRKVRIVRNPQPVPRGPGHRRQGKLHFFRLLSRIDENRHHVARRK